LDISSDKVPSLETLRRMVKLLASWKINQLQLYIEHTYAYQGHETVWKDSSPLTPEDLQLLDEYCKDHFVQLIPNQALLFHLLISQQVFGHMRRWISKPKYRKLAEDPRPFEKDLAHHYYDNSGEVTYFYSIAKHLIERLFFVSNRP
jgi:hexosaminidase